VVGGLTEGVVVEHDDRAPAHQVTQHRGIGTLRIEQIAARDHAAQLS